MARVLVFCLIALVNVLYAQSVQVPILERHITISVSDESLPQVLTRIGQEAGFSFSYNSALVSVDQKITIHVSNETVRNVLNEIFKGSMLYKVKSNYLILTKAPPPVVKSHAVVIDITGYVQDQQTGNKIGQVSVYDKGTLASSVTDSYGYFSIKLEKKSDSVLLQVSKKEYRDTLINITVSENQFVTIGLNRVIEKDSTIEILPVDTLPAGLPKEELVLPYTTEPNVQNIRDTLYELVQVSFLPFLGTNGSLSGNVINDYSINFLGGYSLGTRQIELGFFFNIDRGDVKWLQIAGLGNLVGGKVYGIQAAGLVNLNGGFTEAVQIAGLANTNFNDVRGVQIAGLANTNLGAVRGVQVAGLTNYSRGKSQGVQIAGLGNMQIDDYTGSQVSGITNFATQRISGSQISTLFNYGGNVRGTQIGLINYADSLGGVPIGLISIVKSGYHKIELAADEVFYTNLAFRTGANAFHNILFAGFKPEQSLALNDTSVWTFGYGIGATTKLTRWWHLDFDLTSQHINKGSFTDALSLLNKFYLGFDFQLARKFSIALGATVNGYLTKTTYSDYPILFTDFTPNVFVNENLGNDVNLKMWFGGKFALRFL